MRAEVACAHCRKYKSLARRRERERTENREQRTDSGTAGTALRPPRWGTVLANKMSISYVNGMSSNLSPPPSWDLCTIAFLALAAGVTCRVFVMKYPLQWHFCVCAARIYTDDARRHCTRLWKAATAPPLPLPPPPPPAPAPGALPSVTGHRGRTASLLPQSLSVEDSDNEMPEPEEEESRS